jgi:hypothetical protein
MSNKYLQRLAILILISLLSSCDKDASSEPENNPPEILSIFLTTPFTVVLDSATFACEAIDKDDDPLDYTWFASAGDFLNGVKGQTIVWSAPNFIDSVYLGVLVSDGMETSRDTFYTHLILGPTDSYPVDGQTEVEISPTLNWTMFSPLNETFEYSVFFDTVQYSRAKYSIVSSNELELPELSSNTDYFWRIIAQNESGYKLAGPEWSFRTRRYYQHYKSFEIAFDAGEYNSIQLFKISPNDPDYVFVCNGSDGKGHVYNTFSGELTTHNYDSFFRDFEFQPYGMDYALTNVATDGSVLVFSLPNGDAVKTLFTRKLESPVMDLDYSYNGDYFTHSTFNTNSSTDSLVIYLPRDDYNIFKKIPINADFDVVFGNSSNIIAVRDWYDPIIIYDFISEDTISILPDYDMITDLQFIDNDQAIVFTTYGDYLTIIADVATGMIKQTLPSFGPCNSVKQNPHNHNELLIGVSGKQILYNRISHSVVQEIASAGWNGEGAYFLPQSNDIITIGRENDIYGLQYFKW